MSLKKSWLRLEIAASEHPVSYIPGLRALAHLFFRLAVELIPKLLVNRPPPELNDSILHLITPRLCLTAV